MSNRRLQLAIPISLDTYLPQFLVLFLLVDTHGAHILFSLSLHPLPLAHRDPHTVPVVPLLTAITAYHEPAR